VTVTGGEPTLQPDIFSFLEKLKAMDYLTKVDSNGSRPDVLKKLIDSRLVDYIALDVKAPLARYREITRSGIREEDIRESIECVMSSGVDYEFRTTVVPSLLSPDDLRDIAQTISGARRLALQRFVPSKTLDPAFLNEKITRKKHSPRLPTTSVPSSPMSSYGEPPHRAFRSLNTTCIAGANLVILLRSLRRSAVSNNSP